MTDYFPGFVSRTFVQFAQGTAIPVNTAVYQTNARDGDCPDAAVGRGDFSVCPIAVCVGLVEPRRADSRSIWPSQAVAHHAEPYSAHCLRQTVAPRERKR